MHPSQQQPPTTWDKIEAYLGAVIELVKALCWFAIMLPIIWVIWVLVWGSGAEQKNSTEVKPVTVTIENEHPGDRAVIERAVQVFGSACPDLFSRFHSDIVSIITQVSDTIVARYLEEQKGWHRNVYLRVTLSERADSMPRQWRAGGNTLHYWLGAGLGSRIRFAEGSEPACLRLSAGQRFRRFHATSRF